MHLALAILLGLPVHGSERLLGRRRRQEAIAPPLPLPPSFYGPSCSDVKNLSANDVAELPRHRYELLEECLYYHLMDKADEESGRPGSLSAEPPSSVSVLFRIGESNISSAWIPSEVYKDLYLSGSMRWEWEDPRWSWDTSEWKTEKMKIRYQEHMWVPDMGETSEAFILHRANNPAGLIFTEISATKKGDISSRVSFSMRADCTLDYSHFPNDRKDCCAQLSSKLFPQLIRFNLSEASVRRDPEFQSLWKLESGHLRGRGGSLSLCVSLSRSSNTLSLELSIPMAVSAALLLLASLLPTLGQQHGCRLLSLALQIFCFQYLVAATPQLGFGASVPNIYKFYVFSLVTSLIWLGAGLMMGRLIQRPWTIPPPHRLALGAKSLMGIFCCSLQAPTGHSEPESRGSDWAFIFEAAYAFMGFVFTLIYILVALAFAF